jgi:alkylation response protein AidB-like acyl-CoA dehydrogenase
VRTRADLRLALTHAVRTSARVVDLMYEAAGGSAVFRTSPLQRCFRDVHTATQHAMVAPPTLETIGSVLLGQETDTTLL